MIEFIKKIAKNKIIWYNSIMMIMMIQKIEKTAFQKKLDLLPKAENLSTEDQKLLNDIKKIFNNIKSEILETKYTIYRAIVNQYKKATKFTYAADITLQGVLNKFTENKKDINKHNEEDIKDLNFIINSIFTKKFEGLFSKDLIDSIKDLNKRTISNDLLYNNVFVFLRDEIFNTKMTNTLDDKKITDIAKNVYQNLPKENKLDDQIESNVDINAPVSKEQKIIEDRMKSKDLDVDVLNIVLTCIMSIKNNEINGDNVDIISSIIGKYNTITNKDKKDKNIIKFIISLALIFALSMLLILPNKKKDNYHEGYDY